jgi:hypothetical protein
MAFQVAELSIELIEVLAPLMPRLKQRDKSLAEQLSRAATSVSLNLGEAQLSDPGTEGRGFFRRPAARMRRSPGLWSCHRLAQVASEAQCLAGRTRPAGIPPYVPKG